MIKKLLLSMCIFSSLALIASVDEDEFHAFMQRHRHRPSMSTRIKSFLGQTTAAFSIHYLAQFAAKQLRNSIIDDKRVYLQVIAAWLAADWTNDAQAAIADAFYERPSTTAHALGVIGSLFCQSPDMLWGKWKTGHPWGRGHTLGR